MTKKLVKIITIIIVVVVIISIIISKILSKDKYTTTSDNFNVISFGGGGLRSMSQWTGIVMGMARAKKMSVQQLFNGVETLCSCSGGSWFLSMLCYSKMYSEWIDKVKTGANPKIVMSTNYTSKLASRWLKTKPSDVVKKLEQFNLANKIKVITKNYYQFLGKPWLSTVKDLVMSPITDLVNINMSSSITDNKNIVFFSSMLTSGFINEASNDLFTSYYVTYDLNPYPYCLKNCPACVPVMFSNNDKLSLFMDIDKKPLDNNYKGWIGITKNTKYAIIINSKFSRELQNIKTTSFPVLDAIASSSAAMGFLSNFNSLSQIINNVSYGSKESNSYIGNLISLAFKNMATSVEYFPQAIDTQGCHSDSDCNKRVLGYCNCDNDVYCPDGSYQSTFTGSNKSCTSHLIFGCKCKSPNNSGLVDGVVGQRNELKLTSVMDFSKIETVNLARLRMAVRFNDGGLCDNSAVVSGIKSFQQSNPNSTKICKVLSFCSHGFGEKSFVNTDLEIIDTQISLLFGFGQDGKRFSYDVTRIGIPYVHILGTDMIYSPSPKIFDTLGIPDEVYPDKNSFYTSGNSSIRINRYKKLTTIRNNWYGIEAGTHIDLTVVTCLSKAQDLPIIFKDFGDLDNTVAEMSSIFINDISQLEIF